MLVHNTWSQDTAQYTPIYNSQHAGSHGPVRRLVRHGSCCRFVGVAAALLRVVLCSIVSLCIHLEQAVERLTAVHRVHDHPGGQRDPLRGGELLGKADRVRGALRLHAPH
eukprot:1183059-Prorocentrum_minimum.AAC.3